MMAPDGTSRRPPAVVTASPRVDCERGSKMQLWPASKGHKPVIIVAAAVEVQGKVVGLLRHVGPVDARFSQREGFRQARDLGYARRSKGHHYEAFA